jgi:hypothetical protein
VLSREQAAVVVERVSQVMSFALLLFLPSAILTMHHHRFSDFISFHNSMKVLWPAEVGPMPALPSKQLNIFGIGTSRALRNSRVKRLSSYLSDICKSRSCCVVMPFLFNCVCLHRRPQITLRSRNKGFSGISSGSTLKWYHLPRIPCPFTML